MPYQTVWVDPEIFLTYKGVNVYYTYIDDDVNGGISEFIFTLDKVSDENPFDVRDLDVPSKGPLHQPAAPFKNSKEYECASIDRKDEIDRLWREWFDSGRKVATQAVICEAIDQGLLTAEEEQS